MIPIAKTATKAATPNKALVVVSMGSEGAGACTLEFAPFAFELIVLGDAVGVLVDMVTTVGDTVDAGTLPGATGS
jgi:hypothetical protein